MNVVVALDEPAATGIAAAVEDEGQRVIATVPARSIVASLQDVRSSTWDTLAEADALVIPATRTALTAGVVAACDRHGVRIVPLADRAPEHRHARALGLAEPLSADAEGWRIANAIEAPATAVPAPPTREPGKVIAVWGTAGAPGRTTVAVSLAVELARGGRHVALVDADTFAPSVAVLLGVADEGPGFAAACRQAERGALDPAELTRISEPLGGADGVVDVLTGLNRPSRWPELSASRVAAALQACREWADIVVVDVASSLESDEEIVSDLQGPRRNAATLSVLREADQVVAVVAADPIGISRFLRAHSELRAIVGLTRISVVVNRLRQGPLGIDARGQVRRTLERFGGIEEVAFLPSDVKATDAALLAARPVGEVAGRSVFAAAVRRLVARLARPTPMGGRGDADRRARQRAGHDGRASIDDRGVEPVERRRALRRTRDAA